MVDHSCESSNRDRRFFCFGFTFSLAFFAAGVAGVATVGGEDNGTSSPFGFFLFLFGKEMGDDTTDSASCIDVVVIIESSSKFTKRESEQKICLQVKTNE